MSKRRHEAMHPDDAPLTRSLRWTRLLTQARGDDRAAFDALMADAEQSIWLFAYQKVRDAALADDVVSETFGKVWINLRDYNEELSNARSWIYLIARRTLLDHLDRLRRQRLSEVVGFDVPAAGGEEGDSSTSLEPPDDVELPPPAAADRKYTQALVDEALARLEPGDRAILRLCHAEDKSYEEIARELGCSVPAVGPRLTRARDRFRQVLDGEAQP